MQNQPIFRDMSEIHARLFDHRPILQGHINSFVKEFEEKRGNREMDRLDKLHTTIQSMKNNYLAESKSALETFLVNVHAKLKVAIEVCKKVEEKENNVEVLHLPRGRERRQAEWDRFMQAQFEKSAQVDEDMDNEIERLTAEYQELETKLNFVSSVPS